MLVGTLKKTKTSRSKSAALLLEASTDSVVSRVTVNAKNGLLVVCFLNAAVIPNKTVDLYVVAWLRFAV